MAWIAGNRPLTLDESINNAKMVVNYLTYLGWHSEAILGTIVNMYEESGINPQAWQDYTSSPIVSETGYGLVQWTGADKLINWCDARGLDYTSGNSQLERIQYESENGIQWFANDFLPDSLTPNLPHDPPVTFAEYTQLTDAVQATRYWLAYYEHPSWTNTVNRYRSAPTKVAEWRDYLDGYIPQPPQPFIPSSALPIWMYLRRRF